MSFPCVELIVESIIRDGIEDLKANPAFLDKIFAELNFPYASRKYGATEIQKIKDLVTGANKDHIAIVFAYHQAAAKSPCISIQLGQTSEHIPHAHLGDFENDVCVDLDAGELAALVKVTNLVPTAFTSISGMVSVADGVDLSGVGKGFIYKDGSGVDFVLQGNASNMVGAKSFFIPKGATPDIINPGTLRSPLTEKIVEERGVFNKVHILLGVHTKEPLYTIYLFNILQFILLSRKKDLINRGFINSTLSGSDFNKSQAYQGDNVFTRFLTISGEVPNSWDSTIVNLIDSFTITGIPVD